MDKQAELYQAIQSAVSEYLRTTRGAQAFGSCRLQAVDRNKLLVCADDGESVEIMVMVY